MHGSVKKTLTLPLFFFTITTLLPLSVDFIAVVGFAQTRLIAESARTVRRKLKVSGFFLVTKR